MARVFYLDRGERRDFDCRPLNRLDSSRYAGEPIWRSVFAPVCEVDAQEMEPGSPLRGGPGFACLSQAHNGKTTNRGHWPEANDADAKTCSVEIYDGGSLVRLKRPGQRERRGGGLRGKVDDYSAGSRRRLMCFLSTLKRGALPWFLTVTMPGAVVVPADQLRYAFKRLGQAFCQAFPAGSGVWRKELKDRKSGMQKGEVLAHYHAMVWGVEARFPFQAYSGEWVKVQPEGAGWRVTVWCLVNGVKELCESTWEAGEDRVNEWLGRMWYEFVGSGELTHYKVSSHPTVAEKVRFAQGVRRYASKYMAKIEMGAGSEYAKGRYWGVWNRAELPTAERLAFRATEAQVLFMMRTAKRYVAKQDKAERVKRHQKRKINGFCVSELGRVTKVGRPVKLGHVTVHAFVNNPGDFLRCWEWLKKTQGQERGGSCSNATHKREPITEEKLSRWRGRGEGLLP